MFYTASQSDFDGTLPLANSLVYMTDDNILIKLCSYGEVAPIVNAKNLLIWQKTLKSASTPFKRKLFSREQLSREILFEAMFISSSIESKVSLRIPLSCQVDYMGFRAIVVAVPPINPEQGMSLGFNNQGHYENIDYQLKNELKYVGDVLNHKESKTKYKLQG